MAVVYKYPVPIGSTVEIPDGFIVHFGFDPNNTICVWVQHVSGIKGTMKLYVVGTGHQFSDNDSVWSSLVDGSFVWHLVVSGT